MDIDYVDVAREIGAVSLGEPDVKIDEAAFDFINSTWKKNRTRRSCTTTRSQAN